MRDIERCADLVEAPGLAVLRQFGFDLDPRDIEKVADRVLVFVGVEAAKSGTAALGGGCTFVPSECGVQAVDELVERFGRGPRDGRRGHLTCGDAVMDSDPDSEIIRVAGFIGEFGEVESCGGSRGVVAYGAVLLNEGVGAGEGWTRSQSASSEKSGNDGNSHRKDQLQHRTVVAAARGSIRRDFLGLQAGNPAGMLRGHPCELECASARWHVISIDELQNSEWSKPPEQWRSTHKGRDDGFDPPATHSGAATGLLVKDYRGKDANQEVWKFDSALEARLADDLKQAAIEEGQWSEKREVQPPVPPNG